MSGGRFNFTQNSIRYILEDVEEIINNNSGDYSHDVISEFKTGVLYMKLAYIYAQNIDYLLSGDSGDQSFFEDLRNDINDIGNEMANILSKKIEYVQNM